MKSLPVRKDLRNRMTKLSGFLRRWKRQNKLPMSLPNQSFPQPCAPDVYKRQAYEQLAQTACRTAATSTADDILVSESRGIVTVDGAGTVANLDELKQGYLSFLEQCQFSPRRLEIQKSHGKAIVILDKVVAEQEDQDSYLQLMIYYFEDEQQSQKGLFEGCEKIAPHWYYDIMGLV